MNSCSIITAQVANSLALGTSPIVRALIDPEGGMRDIRGLDNISFTDWFKSHGGSQASIDRMWFATAITLWEELKLLCGHPRPAQGSTSPVQGCAFNGGRVS